MAKKKKETMAKKTDKSVGQLKSETDKLAKQAQRTKQQIDKVQEAADTVAEKAAKLPRG